MSLIEYATDELQLAGWFKKDGMYNGQIGDDVMELIKTFSKQNHSGYSAHIVISLFSKLAKYEILGPLMGNDAEWVDTSKDTYQNKRDSRVFKEKSTGKCYFIEAIVWKDRKHSTFLGWVEGISSFQYIKKFPFIPKTFIVNTIGKEITKGNWEYKIRNKKQLELVANYYDSPEINKYLKEHL